MLSYPGVYLDEIPARPGAITGASTSVTAFVGPFSRGPIGEAVSVTSWGDAERTFGGLAAESEASYGLRAFFLNGGRRAVVVRTGGGGAVALAGSQAEGTGLHALRSGFALLCVPDAARLPDAEARSVYADAAALCEREGAFLLCDPSDSSDAFRWRQDVAPATTQGAAYWPRLVVADPLTGGTREIGPSGAVAGVVARTDTARGVWKAPAGRSASVRGVTLSSAVSRAETRALAQVGVNALRQFPQHGTLVWGARTLLGGAGGDYRYLPVRRLALHIERSVTRGLVWAVFEPNDEPLWAGVRRAVDAFLNELFRSGAFPGSTPRDAYFVRCDWTTMTSADVARGVLRAHIGFAPLWPAEFVVLVVEVPAGR